MDVIALDATSSSTLIPARASFATTYVILSNVDTYWCARAACYAPQTSTSFESATLQSSTWPFHHQATWARTTPLRDSASTIAGTGVQVGKARFGQVTLASSTRGLLRVNRDQLDQVNRLEGVLVMTGLPGCATDADANVAIVKCAPLFLPWQTLHAVEVLRDRHGPVVEVPGFCPRRIAFVAPADRLRGNASRRDNQLEHGCRVVRQLVPRLGSGRAESDVASFSRRRVS